MARALPPLPHALRRAAWWAAALALLAVVLLWAPVRAAIGYVAQASATANGGSITLASPAGAASGDLLLAVVASRGGGSVTASGWNAAISPQPRDGSTMTLSVLYRVRADADPAAFTFNLGAAGRMVGAIVAYRGVDPAAPIAAAAGTVSASASSSITAGAIAAPPHAMLVAVFAQADGNSTITLPAGMSSGALSLGTLAGPNGATLGVGWELLGAAGDSSPRTATSSRSDRAIAALVALRAAPTYGVSGTVFEDLNYGGGAGRSRVDGGGIGTGGARVELYDAAGLYVAATTTAADGSYGFAGLSAGSYRVRVVSETVRSTRAGSSAAQVGVLTYRTDAGSGGALAVTDYVGGTDPAQPDPGSGAGGTRLDPATHVFSAGLTGTAHAVAPVTVGAADVADVDFGFNFSTVVNTRDSGQGSLRQFLLNAAALGGKAALAQTGRRLLGSVPSALPAGVETSIFMIPGGTAVPGQRAALASQLQAGGWARITLASALPAVPAATAVDGATQTANGGDTQPGTVGSGGTVGVSATALPRFDRPEVEIDGAHVVTLGGSGAALRALALRQGRVSADAAATEVSDTLVAMGADGASSAATTAAGAGITLAGAGGIVVRHNYVRADGTGIRRSTAGGTATIERNEVDAPVGGHSDVHDGIALSNGSNDRIRHNLLRGQRGAGYEVPSGGGANVVFEENTVAGNGLAGGSASSEPGGIVVFGSAGGGSPQLTIRGNVVTGNGGPGIHIGAASGILVTRNSIHGNGAGGVAGLGIDLDPLGRDGNGTNPPHGVTANTGSRNAALPNGGMNFPVFTSAAVAASTLTVAGYVGSAPDQPAFAGSVVEVFASDGDASGHGSGRTYLGSLTADASGRFSGALTVPPGSLAVGDTVTATATDASGNTSEFGPNWVTTPTTLAPSGFNAFEVDTAPVATSGVIRSKTAGVAATLAVVALDASGSALHAGFSGTVSLSWVDARDDSGAPDGSCRPSWPTLGPAGSAVFSDNARVTVSVTPPASGTRVMRLKMSSAVPALSACSGDAFAVLPATLTLVASDGDAASAGSARLLASTAATGGVVHRAGRPFTVRSQALGGSGALVTGYDGSPALGIAGCLLPAGCSAGALAAPSAAALAGAYVNNGVTYAEVGAFALELVDADYAAIDAGDTAPALRTIRSAATAVGRFVPDSLELQVSAAGRFGTANGACMAPGQGATFVGQGFGWASAPQVTVTARNAGGATTALWTGALMKLAAAGRVPALTASAAGSATLSSSYGTVAVADLGGGRARLDASGLDRFVLELPAGSLQPSVTPVWDWSLAVTDASEAAVAGNPVLTASATQSGVPFDLGAAFHSARLALSAGHGDARSSVRSLLQLQRWTAAGWVTLTEDRGCVTVQPQHLGVESPSGVFASAGDCVSPLPGAVTTAGGRAWLALPATPGGAPGRLLLRLAGAAATGHSCTSAGASAPLVALGLPWLLGGSTGAGPSALLTWGAPNRDVVLRRETW